MHQQSSSALPRVSPEEDFRIKLRNGQRDELSWLKSNKSARKLNLRWAGGYGKSVGIAIGWRVMLEQNKCDRLFVVVANDAQRDQIANDFASDCLDVGVEIDTVWRYSTETSTIKASETGKHQVFVATIQGVSAGAGKTTDLMVELFKRGGHSWMLAADEYHHYAEEWDWGESLKRLVECPNTAFILATSATPYRDTDPTIFGPPDLTVPYSQAARVEKVLKPIELRRYEYMVDYITEERESVRFKTSELRGGVPKNVNFYDAKSQLRYSAKYVSELFFSVVDRLLDRRSEKGQGSMQMLVRAMDCLHAPVVVAQLKAITNGLTVDWIGTGENGRSDADNKRIRVEFCPPKIKATGVRPPPTLDILVQVAMAGEGLDCIWVSEIVDLSTATFVGEANRAKQFIKRGGRQIESCPDAELFVSVPTDHPLGELTTGSQVEQWIDSELSLEEVRQLPGTADEDERKAYEDWDIEFPDKDSVFPESEVEDVELLEILSGKGRIVEEFRRAARTEGFEPTDEWLAKCWDRAYGPRKAVVEEAQRAATLQEVRQRIDRLAGKVAREVIRKAYRGRDIERSLLGDLKKRINGRMRHLFGARESLLMDELGRVYDWLRQVFEEIQGGEVPGWLG